ncbi:MAG: glutamate synthase central domain-containing protein, partial [Halalkalicoccus sp.]
MTNSASARTTQRGLADPTDERSNCGVGVVMDLDGGTDHGIVREGLELLRNLEHRGTTGAEENTGDGAGIALQRPNEFFDGVLDCDLPETYAVGSLFFPQDETAREELRALIEETLAEHDIEAFAWRDVPTDNTEIGQTALDSEPDVWQCFVEPDGLSTEAFDRALYVGRRAVEKRVAEADREEWSRFYVCSLDRKTIVYKGLLKGEQVPGYYPDLTDERVASTFVMVHERFSTNTLGAWHLAHPYRRIVHNGEINTIQGNINWMRARETDIDHPDLDTETIKPIIDDPGQSDTASVDNALELLLQGGRDLPHALRMLIPEAWRDEANDLPEDRKAWYDFHANLIEPWDGPALVAATDGDRVGAVLDRNGFRPCRYDITADNTLYMASEAGAVDLDPGEIRERGRLQPGQLFLADPEEGRVIPDEEVFDGLVDDRYEEWVARNRLDVGELADDLANQGSTDDQPRPDDLALADLDGDLRSLQAAFGYTHDELDNLLEPMAKKGKDPVGSMGDDTPLSVLSDFNRPLFSYFKQLFAQVTNPPLDYIREELVTSMESRLGHQRNLLDESPEHARQLVVDSPILSDRQTAEIKALDREGLSASVIDVTYDPENDLERVVEAVREEAVEAIESGSEILVLSDRATSSDRVAIPSLLATGAVHHHLVRNGLRNHAGLV